jgi:nanoRNase/pAp phosphatase (c-di-AMP/oligoRNAs hydrolase)
MYASDAGNILSEGRAFAATYYDTDKSRVFSLRSSKGGVDVGEVAKLFGGGGHKHAAGFSVPRFNYLAMA